MAERKARRRRLTDREVLADRDLWIAEQVAHDRSQDYIARRLRIHQSLVSRRLASLPEPIRDRVTDLARKFPDGIPAASMDRIRSALLEYRDAVRARPQPWEDRPQPVA